VTGIDAPKVFSGLMSWAKVLYGGVVKYSRRIKGSVRNAIEKDVKEKTSYGERS